MEKTVKVFIKNPVKGEVKTRLAASVGEEQALVIYQKLLHYTRELALRIDAQKEVWYSKFIDENDEWNSGIFTKKLQYGSDLGQRMSNAFEDSFKDTRMQSIVLIGSDCGELTTQIIEQAFDELEEKNLVFGPAKDGGYYLIGMSKYVPEIFQGIHWSSKRVLTQSLEIVKKNGASYSLLPELSDVDTIEDWEQIAVKMEQYD